MRATIATIVALLATAAASCVSLSPEPARPSPGVVGQSGFAALWPEQILEDALLTQRTVDAGVPGLAWRTDPVATARAFAEVVLGWDAARIADTQTWELRSGVQISRVWLCDENGCPAAGAAFDEEVILKRLVDPGELGVWSVTDVTSGRLFLDQSADIRIRDPYLREGRRLDALAFEGALPDGTRVVAGSTALGSCGPVAETTLATVRLSRIRFQVGAHIGRGCNRSVRPSVVPGYVFAYPQRRGMATDPARLFLGRSEDAMPILDLTAMAVRFVPRDRMPAPPPSWRSRDPTTLPSCRPEQLEAAIGAGRALPGFGVGVFVAIRKVSGPACHAHLVLRLTFSDGAGARIRIPGAHVQPLEGYLPGYVPGTRSLFAGWGLFGWCGSGEEITATVRAPGLVARLPSRPLAQWCAGRRSDPRLENVELDATP